MPIINQVGNSLTGLTGTGTFVGANTPTLITPVLGAATGTSVVLSGKLTANYSINGFATTATAGATTTLTVSSAQNQEFTGTLAQTLVVPVTSTLIAGQQYYIINNSSGVVTVQSSGANTIQAMDANTSLFLTVVDTAVTTAAGWESAYIADTGLAGAVLLSPSGDQTITTGNLSLTTGTLIASSGTFANPIVTTGINDASGNKTLDLFPVSSAVNYYRITNNNTGNNPIIAALGSDTNVSVNLLSKGIAPVILETLGTSNQLYVVSGTTYANTAVLNFPNSVGPFVYTYPAASGTVALAGANTGITSLTGLNGVIQAPTFINDVNGNHVLGFISQGASAVNYIQVSATNTLTGPQLNAAGTDTDISMYLMPKGTGTVNISVTSNIGLFIRSGTTFQHETEFVFANTAQARTVTFPDADGTIQFQGQSLGATVITAPAASAASSLILGTAYQNPFGYDVVLTVYIAVTAATAGTISVGVGPTNTPTQQDVVTGFTIAALSIIPVTIYLPTGYYALLSLTSVTGSISGQQAMPV